ncbi:MAG: hypothetical protein M3151_11025 [Actinomycetota bacterium]|nr:hypothetical protein [Actinomycetota bacterium]
MSEQGGPTEERGDNQEPELDERAAGSLKLLIGRIVSVLGILVGVGGTMAALVVQSTDITAAAAAILLGVVGYFLGARRLGAISVVLGVVLLLVLAGASSGFSEGR